MQRKQLRLEEGFKVVAGNERSQAAVMVLSPDEITGGPDNRHEGSDQWMYVISGEGLAIVEGQEHRLGPGVLLLIEKVASPARPVLERVPDPFQPGVGSPAPSGSGATRLSHQTGPRGQSDGATLFGSRYPGVLLQLQALSPVIKQHGTGTTGSVADMTSPNNFAEETITAFGQWRKPTRPRPGALRPSRSKQLCW